MNSKRTSRRSSTISIQSSTTLSDSRFDQLLADSKFHTSGRQLFSPRRRLEPKKGSMTSLRSYATHSCIVTTRPRMRMNL
ncbi:unnamed protein product [Clonostachys rhizophaga]|uniref:Uncharacterized protein n=1 Tax=Clonostachys rhizophaga TaxID=160324 RepID=A0A9N9VF02_9HYPO|nr:unnamed protein product [Clonostachys rhizophaga]